MGDRAGDLDRWRPFPLLTSASATCASSSAFLDDPERQPRPGAPAECGAAAEWVAAQLRSPAGAWSRPTAIPSCSPSGWARRARRRSSSTATTTCSRRATQAEWTTPPFEPTVRDGRIYARGATDDKGPCSCALETPRRSCAATAALPLNVRFLIEGEEEIGSPILAGFLAAHRDELRARPRRLGRRRDVAAERAVRRDRRERAARARPRSVTGPSADLHSGRHGGAVQNPIHALAADPREPARRRRRASPSRASTTTSCRSAADVARSARPVRRGRLPARRSACPALHGEPGFSTLERLWTRPTLEVNGISGGGVVHGDPAAGRARTSRAGSCPGQDPEAVLAAIRRTSRRTCRRGVERARRPASPARCRPTHRRRPSGGRAAVAALRPSTPAASRCSCASAARFPPRSLFERVLGLKTLLFSFSTADEHLHAPDEFFRLARLDEGIAAGASSGGGCRR